MDSVGAFEAETHLSALLDRVRRGEKITITRRGGSGAAISRCVSLSPVSSTGTSTAKYPDRLQRRFEPPTGHSKNNFNKMKLLEAEQRVAVRKIPPLSIEDPQTPTGAGEGRNHPLIYRNNGVLS